jgi:hypothetical protein
VPSGQRALLLPYKDGPRCILTACCARLFAERIIFKYLNNNTFKQPYARFLRENRHLTKDQWDALSQVLTDFCYIRGIWIILVEELPHVPVLTSFLPSPAPPPHPASAEHEYQDDYHNKERR